MFQQKTCKKVRKLQKVQGATGAKGAKGAKALIKQIIVCNSHFFCCTCRFEEVLSFEDFIVLKAAFHSVYWMSCFQLPCFSFFFLHCRASAKHSRSTIYEHEDARISFEAIKSDFFGRFDRMFQVVLLEFPGFVSFQEGIVNRELQLVRFRTVVLVGN